MKFLTVNSCDAEGFRNGTLDDALRTRDPSRRGYWLSDIECQLTGPQPEMAEDQPQMGTG